MSSSDIWKADRRPDPLKSKKQKGGLDNRYHRIGLGPFGALALLAPAMALTPFLTNATTSLVMVPICELRWPSARRAFYVWFAPKP